ncbi:MAG: hypothetical protein SFW36_06720 [Leptolyngbyaceae cyanobacterium bins.59]|nr:hypothetical protein [Leptolyngbyaceae cyanobacterium bins.59]
MTDIDWKTVSGTIAQGHQVASGCAADSPYPRGTIEMQNPFFREAGLDLSAFFPGTLNVSIHPHTFQLVHPEFTFQAINWTDRHPPETFSFSRCRIEFQDGQYEAWIYYPHPETKLRHFQNPSILEIIALPIAGIHYGDSIKIAYNPIELAIFCT